MESWVEEEVNKIIKETRKENKRVFHLDELKLFLMVIFFAVSFFTMNFSQASANEIHSNYICKNDGVTWKCRGCGKNCWTNSSDWKGQYYCNSCGTKK